jgi:FemAB family protein
MIIKKKLMEIIHTHFPNADSNTDKWQEILKNPSRTPSIPHLFSTVKYFVAYFSDNDALNLSLVLYEKQEAVGIMPLMAHKDGSNNWILSSNGTDIIEPIFKKSLGKKSIKKFETKILNLIFDLSKQLKIKKCRFVNMQLFNLSDWYTNLLELADATFTGHFLFIDLSLSIEEIKSRIRKSVKPLVNKELKVWNIQVHEKPSNELFDSFRLLHKSVVGRSTRPIESWNMQKEQIKCNQSFLVTASDDENCLVGAGLFSYSKNLAEYMSGVYNRQLKISCSHAVQMKAIETLKEKGLKWYELGQKYLTIDKNKSPATKKELSIVHFKEAFATHTLARQYLTITIQN